MKISCAAGSSRNGWKVTWTYGVGQKITQAWNADCTQSGAAATCTNASYNGAVPAGGSTSFGSNPIPTVTLS